ncbi:MAG: 3-deoxy-manno-octulosonate cytidylyltransferase [bacterium]
MSQRTVAVVPARLGSSRFAGKVLFPFRGRPLICVLLAELAKSQEIDELLVATDSKEISRAVTAAGYVSVMTSKRHRTGTDRAAEAMAGRKADIVLNIQADNFGLKAAGLDRVIRQFQGDSEPIGTLARPITDRDELLDPNSVKVVMNRAHHALWFSRLPLPYLQGVRQAQWPGHFRYWHHIGVYLFRRKALDQFAEWKRSALEKAESLEQLRILENGGRLRVYRTRSRAISIDAPRDLKKLERWYR